MAEFFVSPVGVVVASIAAAAVLSVAACAACFFVGGAVSALRAAYRRAVDATASWPGSERRQR